MTVDAFSPRASSTCLRTMRWFFGSRLFAGSLNAAKLIGMRAPGPWTSGAPMVAAEAEPARPAEPATALRATSETVRRNVAERVMREALLRVERGCGLSSQGSLAGPGSRTTMGVDVPHPVNGPHDVAGVGAQHARSGRPSALLQRG